MLHPYTLSNPSATILYTCLTFVNIHVPLQKTASTAYTSVHCSALWTPVPVCLCTAITPSPTLQYTHALQQPKSNATTPNKTVPLHTLCSSLLHHKRLSYAGRIPAFLNLCKIFVSLFIPINLSCTFFRILCSLSFLQIAIFLLLIPFIYDFLPTWYIYTCPFTRSPSSITLIHMFNAFIPQHQSYVPLKKKCLKAYGCNPLKPSLPCQAPTFARISGH